MTAARNVFSSLLVLVCLVGVLRDAEAASSTTPATSTASTTTAASSTASSVVMKSLKKLLSTVEPNAVVDGVSRLVYCSSHHAKAVEAGLTPHIAEWASCSNKSPANLQATMACFIKSTNNLPNFIVLGQQIGDMVGCLLASGENDVLCVKKVHKSEECETMCADARTALSNTTIAVVSPALLPTVRKDDCKLAGKMLTSPGASLLPTAMDIAFKVMQCLPTHFSDMYQNLLKQMEVINTCTQTQNESWTAWARCILDAQEGKIISTYLVKLRLTVACVLGGDIPAQTLCVRATPTAAECKACGGMDTTHLEPAMVLGPTAQCTP